MPQEQSLYTQNRRLDPWIDPDHAKEIVVNLEPGTYERGTLLGRVTASKRYKARAAAATDGSQTARLILRHACTVEANGVVKTDEKGQQKGADAFYRGDFRTEDLIGLDATTLGQLGGRIIEGDLASGIVHIP